MKINLNFKEMIKDIKSLSMILLVIVFLCIIITIVLIFKKQSQEKQDAYAPPYSHITVQKALENGEHLYERDSITGAMIHSQDCPNPLK